ncbi:MAG: hypothetical protein IH888_07080 [Planctomycetes bacterium]|nr:hypothetical protein [Planctomycetota bacterium]
MHKTRLFRIGRASALTAMLGMFIAPLQRLAQAGPVKREAQGFISSSDRYERVVATNRDFWIDAWDWEFVDGKSGMALIEESGPNTWTVGLVDGEARGFVAQGFFTEVFRLPLPELSPSEEELQESGLVSLERYVVAGLIRGSTGYQTALTAVVHEIGIPELDDLVRVITPVQYIGGIGSAVVSSLDFARYVEYASGSQSQYAGYWRCVGSVLLCEAYTLACFAAAPACYAACVAICGSPGVFLCLSCIVACTGGGFAICQLAFDCWRQASRNGCVPW